MRTTLSTDFYLGLVCFIFALLVAGVWIPLDVETGIIEKVRRQSNIGDSLAPTVAAGFIGIGGLLLMLFDHQSEDSAPISKATFGFAVMQIAVLSLGVLIMRYAGPGILALVDGELEYRLLRDTAPWKYIGYFLGSVFIIAGQIAVIEGRASLRATGIAIAITLCLILIYDVPFEDLLLPPNGDV